MNSTSTISSNSLEEEFLDDLEENSDLETDGATKKHPGAFRTISEVAEEIHVPQHVLRFWETRFKQVHPVKRSGGRRYYRAEDVSLLQYISELLYTQGYTIKGVQRVLDEEFSRVNVKDNALEEEHTTSEVISVTDSEVTQELQTDSFSEAHNKDHNELSPQAVSDSLEMVRLREENKLLLCSLRSALFGLQELRKIIATED